MQDNPTPSALPNYLPTRFQRIHLELTNKCNFSCVFCPDGIMERKRGFIEVALAMSAIDEIADLNITDKITFHVMGEPLLHPQFFPILDHARKRSMPVGLTTNGALLSDKTVKALADRDLHQIDISLQTPDAESFLRTRGTRIDFDKYCAGVLDLAAACSRRPSMPIFKFRIMTTRYAGKLRQKLNIPNFLGTSAQLRRTIVYWTNRICQTIGIELPRRLEEKVKGIKIYAWNVIEIAPRIFIETYVLTDWGNAFSSGDVIDANRGYCFGMRDHFAVLYSGDVVLCCVDFDGKTSLGNLHEASLLSILKSEKLEQIMRGFQTGKLVDPHCRRCLGSHSRVGSLMKPTASFVGLKLLKPFFYRHYKLYD
jgi:MoaA/NifB/PqqE/SkfB family radical SAM enzyme